MPTRPVSIAPPRWALVTGCSAGIGHALVEVLRGRGWGVVATARRAEALVAFAGDPGIRPLVLDVTRPETVEAAREACHDLRLVALVNNAGYGQMGPLELLRREELRAQFEINVIGLHTVTTALLPLIRDKARRGEGRIVQVSSALGRLSIPLLGAYNASKHAVVALAETLQLEVGREVRVILVEPGVIDTGFRRNLVNLWGDLPERVKGTSYEAAIGTCLTRRMAFPDQRAMDPWHCAKRIATAMERRHPPRRLIIGVDSWMSQFAYRWSPGWLFDLFVRRQYGRL